MVCDGEEAATAVPEIKRRDRDRSSGGRNQITGDRGRSWEIAGDRGRPMDIKLRATSHGM